jgi:hypothetical protein
MSEAAVGDDPDAVAARAECCTWLWLEAATDWFGQVAKVGDIVLVRVRGRVYPHLIKAVDGRRFLIGNNHDGINGWASPHALYGIATRIERRRPMPAGAIVARGLDGGYCREDASVHEVATRWSERTMQ